MTMRTEPETYLNYINGKWRPAGNAGVIRSINPADRSLVGYIQDSGAEEVDAAVSSAKHAKETWRKLSGAERGGYLYKTADIMERRCDEIARTMTREMGKTFPEAKGETMRGIAILRYYAGEGMRKIGDVIPSTEAGALMFTTRTPLGVVGVIAPWNFPVAIPLWKMAPALVYGNTVVFKPAQETAVTAALVVECMAEAGFPDGVVNMVTGRGSVVGQALIEHPELNGITFTGSNQIGKQIGQLALARGIKYQLEMGGKNPVIVAEDADLDLAADAAVSGGFRSTGQKCTATSRVIVMNGVYEAFKQKLLEKARKITIGNGLEQGIWMGPCANENQLGNVKRYIRTALDEGAELLLGGKSPEGADYANGFYIEPTIFGQVTGNMTIAREEIFGPVLALIRVETMEEAIKAANDSEFGLSASIYTKDIGHILTFMNEMDAGLVRINAETAGVELQAPFGGMKNSSSHSREQGQAAIEFFTSVKTVFVKA